MQTDRKKRDGERDRRTGRQEKKEIDTHTGPTFTAPSVWPQFIARLAGTLVAAQCVEAPLLTTSSVRFGTLIFFYKVKRDAEQLECSIFVHENAKPLQMWCLMALNKTFLNKGVLMSKPLLCDL